MYVNAFDCTLFHKFVKMTSDFHIRQVWQHCRLLQCGSQNSPVKVAALSSTAMWITEQPGEGGTIVAYCNADHTTAR